VKMQNLTSLDDLCFCLTPLQREYLKSIVEAGSHPLNTPVIEDLIELALVRRDGDGVVATEDGRYVANLC